MTLFGLLAHVHVVCHPSVLPLRLLIWEHWEPEPSEAPHSLVEIVNVPVEILVY